jgi:hypothetical protein
LRGDLDQRIKTLTEQFVRENIGKFHEARINALADLKLTTLISRKNPYLFRAKGYKTSNELINALLEAWISSSEEGKFGNFLEALAVFVAETTSGGEKSPAEGIDLDVTRDGTRYLIVVKSGKDWGNSDQHKRLKHNLRKAEQVLKQSKFMKPLQSTLGICYAKFQKKLKPDYLHVGGKDFWELISGDPEFYADLMTPLGVAADTHRENFETARQKAVLRLSGEFDSRFSDSSGQIDWAEVVKFVCCSPERKPAKSAAKTKVGA